MPFQMYVGYVLWQNYIQKWCETDPQKLTAMMEIMPPKKTKKELQAFLGIINYLSNFAPSIADVCEALR